MPLDRDKECECGCKERFAQRRCDQRFKNRKHAKRYFNSRTVYRKVGRRATIQGEASKTLVSARRPSHVVTSLVEGAGVFSHIAGRPRNFGGELTRIAMANPRFILKLSAVSAQQAARPTCRTCELDCADGVDCVKLAVPQIPQIAPMGQIKETEAA